MSGTFVRRMTNRFVLTAVMAAMGAVSWGGFAAETPKETMVEAQAVLNEIMEIAIKSIPKSMFESAEGVAIIPGMIKGGFVIGLQRGNGVFVAKNETGVWEAPRFVTLTGASFGFQAGIQSVDVILVFTSRRSVIAAEEGRFTLGADATIAAGPLGRQTSAATDWRLSSEIYSYSCSRGLFLGAALDGSVMEITPPGDYYKNGVPDEAKKLVETIIRYATPHSGETVPPANLP